MKIAIDESGDTGRKIWKGSSRWFVLAAAIVPEVADGCGQICQSVARYRHQYMNGQELHFAHNSHVDHLRFFEYMHDQEYVYASVVIDKRRLLRSRPKILRSKETLVEFAFDNLFMKLTPGLDDPIVLIDSSGQDRFNRVLQKHLLHHFGEDDADDFRAIKKIQVVDSEREPLVQLADYIAGAVRHYVDNRYPSETYEKFLADKGKIYFI